MNQPEFFRIVGVAGSKEQPGYNFGVHIWPSKGVTSNIRTGSSQYCHTEILRKFYLYQSD